MNVLLLLLASWIPLYGQLSLSSQAPPAPVAGAGAIGARGGTVLYYWVVARYPAGSSSPSTAAMALNTVGELNLTVSNFVRVSWSPMAGATGYDVIRSSSPMMPASCAACAVVLNTSSTTVDDTTPTGSAWPAVGIPVGVPVGGYLTINNRDDATPYLSFQLVSSRINELTRVGLISGTPANDDCIKYSAGRLVSAGAACGSGSGSGGYATIQNNGVAQTQRSILNLVSGSGVNISCADATTKTDCTSAADTGVVASHDQIQAGKPLYLVETSPGDDSYTACPADHAVTAYTTGQVFWFTPAVSNTGPATIDICALASPKAIKDYAGNDPASGDIAAGAPVPILYNGTHFRLPKTGTGGATTGTARHYFKAGQATIGGGYALGAGISAAPSTVAALSALGDSWGGGFYLPKTAGNGVVLHHLLSDWTGSGNITLSTGWMWDGGGGGSGVWRIAVAAVCVAAGDAQVAIGSWNVVQANSSSQTNSDRVKIDSINIDTTGCAAGETLFLHLYRNGADGGDATTATAKIAFVELSYAKTL